jgi:hypothetical protein
MQAAAAPGPGPPAQQNLVTKGGTPAAAPVSVCWAPEGAPPGLPADLAEGPLGDFVMQAAAAPGTAPLAQ